MKKKILDGIDLNISQGDFVCFLGQSGCGKSTLLRLLAGLENPTSGKIVINGKGIIKPSLERSVVFQDYGLFPWMSVGENIKIALKNKFRNLKDEELKERVIFWLKKVGLPENLYNELPKDISGGQKQRCGIARAFAIDSPILLMDEPFGSLDAVTKAKLQNLVLELWESEDLNQRKTIFFVTHDVNEALLLANKIVVLCQTPAKVIYQHNFKDTERPTRETMYVDDNIIQLRNKLIRLIDEDAQERIKNEENQ